MCSGKPGPGANVANAGMCARKKIAGGFYRVRTYHQKITARVRRVISAGSARAEAARGLNARRKAHHRSRAFERNATRDSRKLGLMPFEIAWPGHRISEASQECGVSWVCTQCAVPQPRSVPESSESVESRLPFRSVYSPVPGSGWSKTWRYKHGRSETTTI